jgi:hypothetical protein
MMKLSMPDLFHRQGDFYMNGCVNWRNCRIWGSQQPNEIHEYVHGKTKTSDIP